MMSKSRIKPNHSSLGIEKLISRLEEVKNDNMRLKRDAVHHLLRQMMSEIPYGLLVLPSSLADSLISDSPQHPNNKDLNETLVLLGKLLFAPYLKDDLTRIIKTYLQDRNQLQNEYAASLLDEIIKTENLSVFPKKHYPALKELTLTILEKVINEKQLRKTPGYRLQPLVEIIEPIIYHRLFNQDLDRVRITQQLAFRKFVSEAAHACFEKVTDEKKLELIHKQKANSYEKLIASLKEKIPEPLALASCQEKLIYLQQDKINRFQILNDKLDLFLQKELIKSNQEFLFSQLRIRTNEKLRRILHQIDINPSTYISEENIKTEHASALNEVINDIHHMQIILTSVNSIDQNYSRNIFTFMGGRKHLIPVENNLLDALLGTPVLKTNLLTSETRHVRDNGYPLKNRMEIYHILIKGLSETEKKLSGIFSKQLKLEIKRVLAELETARKKIKTPVTSQKPAPAAQAAPAVEKAEPQTALTEGIFDVNTTSQKAEPKPAPTDKTPKVPMDETVNTEKTKVKPLLIDETFEKEPLPEKVEAKPLMIDETFDAESASEKIEAKPLLINEKVEAESTSEKVEAKPLLIDETFDAELTSEKVEAKPLLIDETFDAEPAPEKAEAKPLLIDETFDAEPLPEKVEAKPLLIDETFDAPHVENVEPKPLFAAELESASSSTQQDAIDAGLIIMKNYQLGSFESTIKTAWAKMVASTIQSPNSSEMGSLPLPSDNEVRLYVICDLAQQVSMINEATLNADQKQALNDIKTKLNNALGDPLSEDSWDYFEGTQRAYIDGTLMSLG